MKLLSVSAVLIRHYTLSFGPVCIQAWRLKSLRFPLLSQPMLLDLDLVQYCGRATLMGVFISFIPANPSPDSAGQCGHCSVYRNGDVTSVHEGTPKETVLDFLFDLCIAQIWLRPKRLGSVVRGLVIIRPVIIGIGPAVVERSKANRSPRLYSLVQL